MQRTIEEAGDGYVTFILDNAPCHRQIRNVGFAENHAFRYLPPYSPFLNIVENVWSTWKAAFKQELAQRRPQLLLQTHAECMAALIDIINRHFDVITVEKLWSMVQAFVDVHQSSHPRGRHRAGPCLVDILN